MAEGWVKLHRSITEWEWYKEPYTRLIFEHLLYTANHAPAKWRGIDIAPGQTVTSIKKLAEANGISVQNVRTALKHLQKTGEITQNLTSHLTSKVTKSARLITVENWALYQTDGDSLTRPLTRELTSNQQGTNKALTTNKNNKKEKNNKNNFIERDIRESSEDNIPDSLKLSHEYFKAIKAQIRKGGN